MFPAIIFSSFGYAYISWRIKDARILFPCRIVIPVMVILEDLHRWEVSLIVGYLVWFGVGGYMMEYILKTMLGGFKESDSLFSYSDVLYSWKRKYELKSHELIRLGLKNFQICVDVDLSNLRLKLSCISGSRLNSKCESTTWMVS